MDISLTPNAMPLTAWNTQLQEQTLRESQEIALASPGEPSEIETVRDAEPDRDSDGGSLAQAEQDELQLTSRHPYPAPAAAYLPSQQREPGQLDVTG